MILAFRQLFLFGCLGILLSSSAAPAAAPVTSGGPGGIGASDGTGSLRLWLRAHDLELHDGDAVTHWPDHSGYGNHAVQGYTGSASAPARFYPPHFRTSRHNGLPTVEFVRQPLEGNRYGSHLRTSQEADTDQESYFIVSHVHVADAVTGGGMIGYTQPHQQGLSETFNQFRLSNAYDWSIGGYRDGASAIRGAAGEAPGFKITAAIRRVAADPDAISIWQNGERLKQGAHAEGGVVSGAYLIGAYGRGGNHQHISSYHGCMSEIIIYTEALNAAQRIIIQNHLAAKYAIPMARVEGNYGNMVALTRNKLYWGNTDARGNCDFGVFGAGRVDAAQQVLDAGMDGFGIRIGAAEDNQWIFAGHAVPENGYVRDGSRVRWRRVWYVQNPDRLSAELAFHHTNAGLSVPPPDTVAVRLLYRESRDLDFAVRPEAFEMVGDTVVFRLTDLATGYYTIGLESDSLPADFDRHVATEDSGPEILQFNAPMTAMIHARHWSETQHQWYEVARGQAQDIPAELYFDAVHRFLLLRFPGSAAAIHAKLARGYAIEKIELRLTWAGDELRRAPGYANRSWPIPKDAAANWHAEVWALRRPWLDDAALGPTWNGYLNGAGWWSEGGARCTRNDRYPEPVGRGGLWATNPEAHIDVTAVLSGDLDGGSIGERLRRFEQCGFLIDKAELYDHDYHQGSSIGLGRIFIHKPELVVFLRVTDAAADSGGELPPELDVRQYAEGLKAAGGDGLPSTRRPENIEAIAATLVTRRRDSMPNWMWQRVQEVQTLPPYHEQRQWFDQLVQMVEEMGSSPAPPDFDAYEQMVQRILNMPPAWFQGHANIEFPLALIAFGDLLPDVVHYHLRQDWRARWGRPLSRRVFSHGMGGTLNHCAQIRSKVWLGSELTGDTSMLQYLEPMLRDLNERLIYSSGFSQELGDSYYRGITLAPLQAVARYGLDPVIRLHASLMVEKLLFEDISTFHPGLRKRVSSINRRMGNNLQESLLLGQDVPEAALHTLSRAGVLIETDSEGPSPIEVHGMRVLDLHATAPGRVALVAPWGADWEWNAIDHKPLPFLSVHTEDFHGRLQAPRVATTYLGRHYGLGSHNVSGPSHPVFAVWRRGRETVERVEQLGAMLIQGRINEQPPGNVSRTPVGILQHKNRLIWVMKPYERRFLRQGHGNLPDSLKDGLTSYKTQVSLHAFGPEEEREIWINDRHIEQWPATARQGDVITIREGVAYLGLIPLPATDLGRDQQVLIRHERPVLTFDSYLLKTEQPAPHDSPVWNSMQDATAGWIVELGDADEHGSFESFRLHMLAGEVLTRWEAGERLLHVQYRNAAESMEMGFSTAWQRSDLWHDPVDPVKVIRYQRVNGRDWPDLPAGVTLDNPSGQMGVAELLQKGGASLRTAEGRTALLRVEPIGGVTVGINPFSDPQPFELTAPGGMKFISEGPLGLARLTIREPEEELHIDYAPPPPANESTQSAPTAATVAALRITGVKAPPRIVLNGRLLQEPLQRTEIDGAVHYRIPLAP